MVGRRRAQLATLASAALAVAIVALMAWKRRWIADDGMIVVRTVLQLLDGHGPTFNAYERCEANTSTLWTYVLALFGAVTPLSIPKLTVFVGWTFTVVAVILGFDASRRFHRRRGDTGPLLPVGGAAVVALYPFWDYATAGLETGMCWCWIAGGWWCLVALSRETSQRRMFLSAFVFGLGPLVRPDLAVVSVVFLGAAWLVVRPSRRQTLAAIGAAGALPIAYEVFRAGYYGILVPMPALAKSASASAWGRGFAYVLDFAHPFVLWIPLLVLVGVLVYALARRRLAPPERIVVLAPLAAGGLLTLFIVKVGGDFMHGRMMTTPFLLAMLPAFMLPVRRITLAPIAIVLVWAVAVGWIRNDNRGHETSPFVNDERLGYRWYTGKHNPIDPVDFIRGLRGVGPIALNASLIGKHEIVTEGGAEMPMNPALHAPLVFFAGRLGTGGLVTPREGITVDTLGLANPIGSRIEITNPDNGPGHQKVLPMAWLYADYLDPSVAPPDGTPRAAVESAHHAMACGEIAEMLASVREPMTAHRFWANLTGSVRRTTLRIPSDPALAEKMFCTTSERP